MLDPGTNLLTKPFSIEDLAAKVRKILDDGPEETVTIPSP
jgi:DNA-binding response OmpR family regulator